MKNLGWFRRVKCYSSDQGESCGTHLSLDCGTKLQFTAGTDGKFLFSTGASIWPSEERGGAQARTTRSVVRAPGNQQGTNPATSTAWEGKRLVTGSAIGCESPPGLSLLSLAWVLTWGFSALCNVLSRDCSQGWETSTTVAAADTRGNRHTKLTRYLVIDCHFRVGITFVESLHLTEQMRIWQIHHPELNRAGMDQGRELELSEGRTNSKVSNARSHLTPNQYNTQAFTHLLRHFSPLAQTRTMSCLSCYDECSPPANTGSTVSRRGEGNFCIAPTLAPSSRRESWL